MADWTMRQNDRLPSIAATLKNADGTAIDLTGATVKFQMNSAAGVNKINTAATVLVAASGTVQYDWGATDTDTAGEYVGCWEITFGSGKKTTCPNGSNYSITIVTDLA